MKEGDVLLWKSDGMSFRKCIQVFLGKYFCVSAIISVPVGLHDFKRSKINPFDLDNLRQSHTTGHFENDIRSQNSQVPTKTSYGKLSFDKTFFKKAISYH